MHMYISCHVLYTTSCSVCNHVIVCTCIYHVVYVHYISCIVYMYMFIIHHVVCVYVHVYIMSCVYNDMVYTSCCVYMYMYIHHVMYICTCIYIRY